MYTCFKGWLLRHYKLTYLIGVIRYITRIWKIFWIFGMVDTFINFMIRSISISCSLLCDNILHRSYFLVIFSCPPFRFRHHCVFPTESLSLSPFLPFTLSFSLSSSFPPYCVSMGSFVLVFSDILMQKYLISFWFIFSDKLKVEFNDLYHHALISEVIIWARVSNSSKLHRINKI